MIFKSYKIALWEIADTMGVNPIIQREREEGQLQGATEGCGSLKHKYNKTNIKRSLGRHCLTGDVSKNNGLL